MPPLHHDVTVNAPLSDARLATLVAELGITDGDHVVDLGCGWGELLLRAVAAAPETTGTGIDSNPKVIAPGRSLAAARGLADRVTLTAGDASEWSGTADVLVVNGATHVWGGEPVEHTGRALTAAARALRPGGRLLFGECFWTRRPTDAELAAMPMSADEYGPLPELVDRAGEHGFRLLHLAQSSRDEWDHFESRHALGWERWLLANPGSPDAGQVRTRADTHRRAWLHGYRECLGYAALVLVRTS